MTREDLIPPLHPALSALAGVCVADKFTVKAVTRKGVSELRISDPRIRKSLAIQIGHGWFDGEAWFTRSGVKVARVADLAHALNAVRVRVRPSR